jgi:hypothetical protein
VLPSQLLLLTLRLKSAKKLKPSLPEGDPNTFLLSQKKEFFNILNFGPKSLKVSEAYSIKQHLKKKKERKEKAVH